MTTKVPFLTATYGAYLNREVPKEDAELTHVGPGTPAGEYLRRFWQPVAHGAELRDVPLPIRIMGEDLVLFRDRSGRVGLLQRHCSHRGTSLEFGIVSERGLRCCYHGWLFDVDGRVLETPAEPADSTLKDRLCHGAYPTLEFGGLVFAYMGPPDRKPAFPLYDTFQLADHQLLPGPKFTLPCNWLQVKDNCMDPVHGSFLHAIVSGYQFTEAWGVLPELEFQETDYGMIYIATRRLGERVWVRISDFMVPNIHQFPPDWDEAKEEKIFDRPMITRWAVPIDDTTTMNIDFAHYHASWTVPVDRVVRPAFGQTADRPYEERQRAPGDYDAQVAQRPIAVHALEHLASSDRGVIMFRKLVRDGVRAVQAGGDPFGASGKPGDVIPTLGQNTILRIPPAPTAEADRELLRETGRRVARGMYAAGQPVGS
jgi:phenylpropionate dioxygenase-like ring-hydroxylating dioxygenase large terminal subunit